MTELNWNDSYILHNITYDRSYKPLGMRSERSHKKNLGFEI